VLKLIKDKERQNYCRLFGEKCRIDPDVGILMEYAPVSPNPEKPKDRVNIKWGTFLNLT